MSFIIKFYQDRRGCCPVTKFIDKLEKPEQAKIHRDFDLQKEHGPQIPFPHTRHIEGKIWELRVKHKRCFRFFYFVMQEREIVHVHAIVKGRDKVLRQDIDIAIGRMNDILTQ